MIKLFYEIRYIKYSDIFKNFAFNNNLLLISFLATDNYISDKAFLQFDFKNKETHIFYLVSIPPDSYT